jgi:hypothetical protein
MKILTDLLDNLIIVDEFEMEMELNKVEYEMDVMMKDIGLEQDELHSMVYTMRDIRMEEDRLEEDRLEEMYTGLVSMDRIYCEMGMQTDKTGYIFECQGICAGCGVTCKDGGQDEQYDRQHEENVTQCSGGRETPPTGTKEDTEDGPVRRLILLFENKPVVTCKVDSKPKVEVENLSKKKIFKQQLVSTIFGFTNNSPTSLPLKQKVKRLQTFKPT